MDTNEGGYLVNVDDHKEYIMSGVVGFESKDVQFPEQGRF